MNDSKQSYFEKQRALIVRRQRESDEFAAAMREASLQSLRRAEIADDPKVLRILEWITPIAFLITAITSLITVTAIRLD